MKFIHAVMATNTTLAIALGAFALTACPQGVPVVGPVATLAQCIASDALGGKSVAQIALDCGADVPSVLIALINATDPGVLGSRAHAEAMTARASLASDAGVAAIGSGK